MVEKFSRRSHVGNPLSPPFFFLKTEEVQKTDEGVILLVTDTC